MIDSYSDVILRAFDATPNDVVLRTMPSPRNPQNYYPTAAQTQLGIQVGAGQFFYQEYETGTLVAGGGSASYRPIGSSIVRRVD